MVMAETMEPGTRRLFVALPLPVHVRTCLKDLQSVCRAELVGMPLRWTSPDHFHLTLRFLGEVESTCIADLKVALVESCGAFRPITLRCCGLGLFKAQGRPSVLWSGVKEEGEHLNQLQRAVAVAANAFSDEPPAAPFHGHITLGRCKRLTQKEALPISRLADRFAGQEHGAWVAKEILLMRSNLGSDGPEHHILETIPLQGA
jgi:RNA 2',3'-cyclic 3'-phosphodiesterase